MDRHNRGGPIPSESEEAEILVADLTNERPTHPVRTACADRDPDAADRRPGGPRVHVDVASRREPEKRAAPPGAARVKSLRRKPLEGAVCALLMAGLALAWAPLFSACAHGGGESAAPARARGTAPYRVNGKRYVPLTDWRGYREEGVASWYGAAHHGKQTASGERFDAYRAYTAAHKTLPFDVCAEVENLQSGKTVRVRINDRGPFAKGRVIDLSKAAAAELGLVSAGVAKVRVEAVGMANAKGECRG